VYKGTQQQISAPSDCLLLGAVYKFAYLLTYYLLTSLLTH